MAERVFAMPDLGEGLEEGKIVAWLVAEGDQVELNQPLVEVDTAKAAVEIPSPYAGRVVALHGSVGEDVPVGAPLVTFLVGGDELGDVAGGGSPDRFPRSLTLPQSRWSGDSAPGSVTSGTPAKATPAVRKLARDLGVDLAGVIATGPDGRVVEGDVRAAAVKGGASEQDEGDFERIEVSSVRREIARVLGEVAAIPQVTTFRTVDCGALEAVRRELEVSPLPVVISALARTYPAHPLLNASWHEDEIRTWRHLHVGLAVDAPRGLVVPRLRDADTLGIGALAEEIRRSAEAAREDHLSLEEVTGPVTMGVSNTGAYGSEAGTPLLTPGCAVTIAFGVISPRALIVEGEVVARPAATISLTFDHRVLDGAAAGRALTALVALLQSPDRLRDLPS